MNIIVCKKDKCHGIHAELVGENLLQIQKRKTDKHPLLLKLTGSSFDLISSCTLCGTEQLIEVVDGKINMDDVKVIEVKGTTNGEELSEEDTKGNGTGGDDKDSDNNGGEPIPTRLS